MAAIRHTVPYGDLETQAVQRFGSFEDLDSYKVTIEGREEYEPLIGMGLAVFAGVDYHAILRRAEDEADIVIWDGGNNDFSFIKSGLHIVLVDPHRPGHETSYHPGEANLRMADVVVINKVDSATKEQLAEVQASVAATARSGVPVALANSIFITEQPEFIKGKRVLTVGDDPTLTPGGMPYDAARIASRKFGAAKIVPGKAFAVGSIKAAYEQYQHMEMEVPALGYSPEQLADLQATLNAAEVDPVVYATPVDLSRLVTINKPMAAVEHEFKKRGPQLQNILTDFDARLVIGG